MAVKRARKRVDAFVGLWVGRSVGTRRQFVDGRPLPKAVKHAREMEIAVAGAADQEREG